MTVFARALLQVGIKRRYNNVLVDTDKQQQIEMFLGMKQAQFFPSLKLLYKVGCRRVLACVKAVSVLYVRAEKMRVIKFIHSVHAQ